MSSHNWKYKDSFFIEKYTALWAYGYLNDIGQSEGLYRTINELGFSCLDRKGKYNILDIGCGVGRTTADYARFFSISDIVGIDDSSSMIAMAQKINKTDETVTLDMTSIGLKVMSITGQVLHNLSFYEKRLVDYVSEPLKGKFDLITAVNVIDRIDDIEKSLENVYSLLKFGGIFILASPINFSNSEDWKNFGSAGLLSSLVQRIGFKIDVKFDGLVYKEVLDARGATEEYLTVVMRLVKP